MRKTWQITKKALISLAAISMFTGTGLMPVHAEASSGTDAAADELTLTVTPGPAQISRTSESLCTITAEASLMNWSLETISLEKDVTAVLIYRGIYEYPVEITLPDGLDEIEMLEEANAQITVEVPDIVALNMDDQVLKISVCGTDQEAKLDYSSSLESIADSLSAAEGEDEPASDKPEITLSRFYIDENRLDEADEKHKYLVQTAELVNGSPRTVPLSDSLSGELIYSGKYSFEAEKEIPADELLPLQHMQVKLVYYVPSVVAQAKEGELISRISLAGESAEEEQGKASEQTEEAGESAEAEQTEEGKESAEAEQTEEAKESEEAEQTGFEGLAVEAAGVIESPEVTALYDTYFGAGEKAAEGTYEALLEAKGIYESLSDFLDSSKKAEGVLEQYYRKAIADGDAGDYDTANSALEAIRDYADAESYITYFNARRAEEKNTYSALAEAHGIYVSLGDLLDSRDRALEVEGKLEACYLEAQAAADEGRYADAVKMMEGLGEYADAPQYVTYYTAGKKAAEGTYKSLKEAKAGYETIPDFLDSSEKAADALEQYYRKAIADGEAGNYAVAVNRLAEVKDYADAESYLTYFSAKEAEGKNTFADLREAGSLYASLGDFLDSRDKAQELTGKVEAHYQEAQTAAGEGRYADAAGMMEELGDYEAAVQYAVYYAAEGKTAEGTFAGYTKALNEYQSLGDFLDSAQKAQELGQKVEARYQEGLAAVGEGRYADAMDILGELGDYADTKTYLEEYKQYSPIWKIRLAAAGDVIEFGRFEQDNNTGNGAEPIEWYVLAAEEGRILVLSKYVLDAQAYHQRLFSETITWEGCTLRSWLNNDFLSSAFTEDEQGMIELTMLTNADNPSSGIPGGNSTEDRIFALSIDEQKTYLTDVEKSTGCRTQYAMSRYVFPWPADDGSACWWWLRSPGNYDYKAAYVDEKGMLFIDGTTGNSEIVGVRPALYIDTDF